MNNYQTKIFIELLKNIENKTCYLLSDNPYYGFVAGFANWFVKIFEKDYNKYHSLCQNIHNFDLSEYILPIYVTINHNVTLDHLIQSDHIGVLLIDVNGYESTIIDGLSHALSHDLIDCIICTFYTNKQPINNWSTLVEKLRTDDFVAFDLNHEIITDNGSNGSNGSNGISLYPLDYSRVMLLDSFTILFVKKLFLNEC